MDRPAVPALQKKKKIRNISPTPFLSLSYPQKYLLYVLQEDLAFVSTVFKTQTTHGSVVFFFLLIEGAIQRLIHILCSVMMFSTPKTVLHT